MHWQGLVMCLTTVHYLIKMMECFCNFQILPNLPGKRGNRVKDLQKKLAERDDSRQSVIGKQDPSVIASKQSVKVQYTCFKILMNVYTDLVTTVRQLDSSVDSPLAL